METSHEMKIEEEKKDSNDLYIFFPFLPFCLLLQVRKSMPGAIKGGRIWSITAQELVVGLGIFNLGFSFLLLD